jgi:trans-aconitate methyltransferase
LAAAGGLVQGVDLSQPMLERAQARSNQVEFIRADAGRASHPNNLTISFSRALA